MGSRSDPVEHAADDGHDLYDVATWEKRTRLDGVAVALHWLLTRSVKAIVVVLAAVILLGILASVGVGLLFDPAVAALVSLSAIPAFGLAAYVYVSDVTDGEPLSLLVVTFLLSVLTATFAAVFNSVTRPFFAPLGFVGPVLFFFLVVGPVEESVKLLAVRLYAYVDDRFDAVIDGAVYGAIAGLGFAVIENLLYIAQIVIKGVVIAAAIHGLYNTLVGPATAVLGATLGLSRLPALFVFVVAFQGAFGLLLVRKLRRYRDAYRMAREPTGESGHHGASGDADADRTGTTPLDGPAATRTPEGGETAATDRHAEPIAPSGVTQDLEAWTFDAVQPPSGDVVDANANDGRTTDDDADADPDDAG